MTMNRPAALRSRLVSLARADAAARGHRRRRRGRFPAVTHHVGPNLGVVLASPLVGPWVARRLGKVHGDRLDPAAQFFVEELFQPS
jgi:hypothetical protein